MSWLLGSFNAAMFMLVLLLLAYPRGGLGQLLAGLSTLSGLALYVALWATSVYAARRALRGLDLFDPGVGDAFFGRALRGGAFTGAAFLVELALVLAVAQLTAAITGGPFALASPLFFVPFGVIALLVAAVVGALVGVVLGAANLAAVRLSALLAGVAGSAERIAGDGRTTPDR